MAEYIERDKAIDELRQYIVDPKKAISDHPDDIEKFNDGIDTAISVLSTLPTADKELAKDINVHSKPKWISVNDKLPEEYTRVLAFMAWKQITAIEYQNGKWYSIDHLQYLPDEAVTHWMPLPEPPKEE